MRVPDQGLVFDPPLRIFNLSGGISCLTANSGLNWLMLPNDYGAFWSEMQSNTYQISQIKNLRKISFHNFDHAEELENGLFEDTYIDLEGEDGTLLDESQINRWMGLTVAYRNEGLPRRAMRAERIAKQIRFCRSAIDKLFKSYRMCLAEKCHEKNVCDLESGTFHFFSDPFAQNISFCLQPCLDALFSLRDFLLTFLFEEMYETKTKLSRMIDVLRADDRYGISNLISNAMSQKEPYGIVARTATYRNAFFHYLGSSGGPLSEVYCLQFVRTAFGQIPRVTYPLDDKFERVRSVERGEFAGYGSKDQHDAEAKRFMSSGNYVDALDLCFDCLATLLGISRHMEKSIAIESQTLTLTDHDILEAEIIKDGVRRRYKRNADGKLEMIEEE